MLFEAETVMFTSIALSVCTPSFLRFVAEDAGTALRAFGDLSLRPSNLSDHCHFETALPALGDSSLWPVTEAKVPDRHLPTLETALLSNLYGNTRT